MLVVFLPRNLFPTRSGARISHLRLTGRAILERIQQFGICISFEAMRTLIKTDASFSWQVGRLMDSGNVIVSRYPLSSASMCTFQNASGWQSFVPNGILHAMCTPPTGIEVHLFTT